MDVDYAAPNGINGVAEPGAGAGTGGWSQSAALWCCTSECALVMVGVGVAEGGGAGAGAAPGPAPPSDAYYGEYYPPEYYVPEMCPHPQHPHMCTVHTDYGNSYSIYCPSGDTRLCSDEMKYLLRTVFLVINIICLIHCNQIYPKVQRCPAYCRGRIVVFCRCRWRATAVTWPSLDQREFEFTRGY
ncbi:hypothetical protein EVAR_95192_1 [Eumeta japonica]|uniref:Uncharacterized protein n=1 Tax=Eumeta variegata TaxID=151549 RepID=A0A4C1VGM3_EUMVA|nr:hypothetical protein EVAR_95192_1 [Eumeta japonica]